MLSFSLIKLEGQQEDLATTHLLLSPESMSSPNSIVPRTLLILNRLGSTQVAHRGSMIKRQSASAKDSNSLQAHLKGCIFQIRPA